VLAPQPKRLQDLGASQVPRAQPSLAEARPERLPWRFLAAHLAHLAHLRLGCLRPERVPSLPSLQRRAALPA
jgi:hypothetical protein